jgi:hypothetical protein
LAPTILALLILALWAFPFFWYSVEGTHTRISLTENANIPGWIFDEIPISESAERLLVADHTINGEFRNGNGEAIRVFSAKRLVENANEIGLFVHTPDRCWVQAGWRIHPITPEIQEITLHGKNLQVERRLFQIGQGKELVYFFGLVNGHPLPYRLDHNLARAARVAESTTRVKPAADLHFWQRLWTSFSSRHKLSGPKHFVRISTPVQSDDLFAADSRLQSFATKWLVPGEFKFLPQHSSEPAETKWLNPGD